VEEHCNKRGDLVRAKNTEQHCFMNLRFFMHDKEQTWHFYHKSNLKHSYHMPEEENAKTLNKNDLNDDQLATLNILYSSGVAPSVIAKAMTKSVQSTTGKKGQFVTDTINNIGEQKKVAMAALEGLKSTTMNQAKRTIAMLDC